MSENEEGTNTKADAHGLPAELADVQRELFRPEELPEGRELLLAPERQVERFTLAQVKQNQARYDGIVRALAEGMGIRKICRVFRCSPHVVQSIRERDPELVATEKQRWIKQLTRVQWLCVDKLTEALEDGSLPASQVSVPLGIVSDKKALAEGTATQVVEVRREVDPASVAAAFRNMIGPGADSGTAPPVLELEEIRETSAQDHAPDHAAQRKISAVGQDHAGQAGEQASADAGAGAREGEGGGSGASDASPGQ